MSKRDDYPPGAPCWVDTWQPDPRAALRFYGALLGWSFDEATSMPNGLGGDYFGARVAGRLVAGIGQAPASSPAVWSTYVRVGDIDQALARAEEAGGARLAGPMDAGSDGRLAVLTDATDVPFCLWQAGTRIGAELVNAEHLGDELAPQHQPRTSASVLRGRVRLGTRAGTGRSVLPVAALEPGRSRGDSDRRRHGPAALERQSRRPRPTRSPITPPPWAAPSCWRRSTRRAIAARSSRTRRAASSPSARPPAERSRGRGRGRPTAPTVAARAPVRAACRKPIPSR